MNLNISSYQILMAFSFIIGCLVIGLIFEKFLFFRLHKFSIKTKWEGDDIIIASLRGIATFWFIMASLYIALLNIPINSAHFTMLQKLVVISVMFSVTIFLAKITVGFVSLFTRKTEGVLPSTSIFSNLTRVVVFVIGILVILQTLGISITPVLTALGVGGLAVALALQETLSNLFAGLQIIISRQIKPGDYIKLETGEEGYVVDVTWRNTAIKALANNMIVIPNSKLASAIITNYYQPAKEMSVLVQVGVSYDSDLEQVEKITIEVAREVLQETPGGIPNFQPMVRFHTFADFSINFTVILRVGEFVDQYLLKHAFVKKLHRRYQEEGIEIPFPIRTIHLKKE